MEKSTWLAPLTALTQTHVILLENPPKLPEKVIFWFDNLFLGS